jgi:hypothetical protein
VLYTRPTPPHIVYLPLADRVELTGPHSHRIERIERRETLGHCLGWFRAFSCS